MSRRARDYIKKWDKFTSLSHTQDILAEERRGLRQWILMPYVSFLIPVDDPDVSAQLVEWQKALQPWLPYDPQPPDRLHITLHYVGMLRSHAWKMLPHTWQRKALPRLAQHVREPIESIEQFDVKIGPLNAFPGVLFAEVHDGSECLRMLRARIRGNLPLRARPPSTWSYLPHVTLGLWGRQPAEPVIDALEPYRHAEPLTMRVRRVKFTIYTRDLTPLGRNTLETAREEIIAEYHLKERTS